MNRSPRSRLIVVDVNFDLATFSEAGAKHAGGIEAPGKLAIGGYCDDSAVSVDGSERFVDDLVSGLLQGEPLVLHESADFARNRVADEVLTNSSARDGAGLIRSISA